MGEEKKSKEARHQTTERLPKEKSVDHLKPVSHLLPDSRRPMTEDSIQFHKHLSMVGVEVGRVESRWERRLARGVGSAL